MTYPILNGLRQFGGPESAADCLSTSRVLDQFAEIELKSQSKSRCRKVSPAQGQRHGICIAAESVSMRPVWNREHCGCARALPTGNTHLLHRVPFRDDPILFCSGGSASRSSWVPTTASALGNSDMLYPLLGLCRSYRHSQSLQVRCNVGKHGCYSLASWYRVHWWDAPEFSKDCPL
jgi:hypothetical protein